MANTDMLTCTIIDDEPLAARLLESYVRKTPFLSLAGVYGSALEALPALQAEPVDVLFLDIQMPELSGMEFSRIVPRETRIIFTTAFEQYALDSYKVNALDYLLKPISYADFLQSVRKAEDWFHLLRRPADDAPKEYPESLFIKTEYKLVQVELSSILYIEGLKDYVKIHLADEPHPLLSLTSLKALEENLPPDRFVRVHRSFIVHLDQIKSIERNRIVFGKDYVPISDSYRDRFYEVLSRRTIGAGRG